MVGGRRWENVRLCSPEGGGRGSDLPLELSVWQKEECKVRRKVAEQKVWGAGGGPVLGLSRAGQVRLPHFSRTAGPWPSGAMSGRCPGAGPVRQAHWHLRLGTAHGHSQAACFQGLRQGSQDLLGGNSCWFERARERALPGAGVVFVSTTIKVIWG